jgi:hypothetical protein
MIQHGPTAFKISYETEDGAHHVQHHEIHAPAKPLLPTERPAHVFPRPPGGNWSMLAGRGDEWFAAHLQVSMLPNELRGISPLVFTFGHALELYLKAAVAVHASFQQAERLGHKLPKLWGLCETYAGFPFKGMLQPELFDRNKKIYDQGVRSSLQESLRQHLSENEFLYLALRHLQDLKYLGLPGRTIPANQALTFGTPVPNKVAVWQLGTLAQWVWGEWCCKPGYKGTGLYQLANGLLQA